MVCVGLSRRDVRNPLQPYACLPPDFPIEVISIASVTTLRIPALCGSINSIGQPPLGKRGQVEFE